MFRQKKNQVQHAREIPQSYSGIPFHCLADTLHELLLLVVSKIQIQESMNMRVGVVVAMEPTCQQTINKCLISAQHIAQVKLCQWAELYY